MFHDVGHPPYSHIIEKVLYDLYNECNTEKACNIYDRNKIKKFNDCILPYATNEENKAYQCHTLISNSSLINAALHERIGLSLLQSAILYVIPNIIQNIYDSSREKHYKVSSILYYIMVIEIASAILVEKDDFFKSFHKIVDGIIDADRLDYIMRDSINSGVDWGHIPYKRLINSAKLVNLSLKNNDLTKSDIFVIAYPKKVSDDINDLLLTRYKIFARINFHHRCMKTTVPLQSIVKDIAKDYLMKKDKTQKGNIYINSAIETLWSALDNKAGERSIRIIQWNDSWLISALHKALVNINSNPTLGNKLLKDNLEEILLNKKRYYTLLKRGSDSRELVKKIFDVAGITEESLNKLKLKESEKYYNNMSIAVTKDNILNNPNSDGMDSIKRCDKLLEVFNTGDLECLNEILPLLNKNISDVFDDTLKKIKDSGDIVDYKVITNYDRSKLGLPRHDDEFEEIYLYNQDDDLVCFDEYEILFQQIKSIERSIPWIYVYVIPSDNCSDMTKLFDSIKQLIAKNIGNGIKKRFKELFESKNI